MPDVDPALGIRFYVKIEDKDLGSYDLGSFTGIEGLSAEYDVQRFEEGGVNDFVHNLPGRLKYNNIKLSRAVDRKLDAGISLAAWFSQLARGKGLKQRTATVTAYSHGSEVVAEWHLTGVFPVKYTGPSFSTDGGKVAIESVELAHEGFFSMAASQ
jgi:phage tail-like protein